MNIKYKIFYIPKHPYQQLDDKNKIFCHKQDDGWIKLINYLSHLIADIKTT